MNWILDFDLFLFDFDGLLVDTEQVHYQAYKNLCAKKGFSLPWSFPEFCEIAHFSSDGLRREIYALFPALYEKEPNWNVLYEEKKQEYQDLIRKQEIPLLPGVFSLLEALKEAKKTACVVTNSIKEHVEYIKAKSPALQKIPYWITRESYENPKPSPECYHKAIQLYGKGKKNIIGFEDSARGLKALLQTPCIAVLVCPEKNRLPTEPQGEFYHFEYLDQIPSKMKFAVHRSIP